MNTRMLTRIVLAWAPAALALMLVACGSKGDLVLPKAQSQQSAAPTPAPATPARPVPTAPPATPAAPAAPAAPSPAKQP